MGSLRNLYIMSATALRYCLKSQGMSQISRPVAGIVMEDSFILRRYLHDQKPTTADEVLDDEPEDSNKRKVDPKFDRSKVIPLETSIRYLDSAAYKETYGNEPIWVPYRRNFKGQFQPTRTRRTCIREGRLRSSNACPICRDELLVVDYRNVKLLKQFISPYNGAVLHWDKTGVCRDRQLEILVAIEKARDYGTITFDLPVRNYDYSEYYSDLKEQQ